MKRIFAPSRPSASHSRTQHCLFTMLVAIFAFVVLGAAGARAQGTPPGCAGSAIGISLFGSATDVHVGDTLFYSASVFNGIPGNPTSCDASNVVVSIATPDGVIHPIALRKTYLHHAESDYYTNVVSYTVRAQDIRSDGTVRATAEVTAKILQNDIPSDGGANQGVNTQIVSPCVGIFAQCSGGVGENGIITVAGLVTNCGNDTLVGVTVTNFINNGAFLVLGPTNMAPGRTVSFSTSYVATDPCAASVANLLAVGADLFTFTPQTVTASTTTTCSETLAAGIRVTADCSETRAAPGQLVVISGSVSNTGNVTLSNIVVVNSQPAPGTPIFARASLVPGEMVTFTGNFLAPTNCSVTSALTADAISRCGAPVTSSASTVCQISTTPAISVTEVCPATSAVSGETSSFSGVVRNTGDVTLTNVTVVSDRPVANTVVFTGTLAPGTSANYSGTFTVPLNVCSVTTIVRATGADACTGATVANNTSATCSVVTAPAIAVTLACPAAPATNGTLITYTGTVRNSGNVTLNNVVVTNAQASPPTVFSTASLAPSESANFTASFVAPSDTCSISSTVMASGRGNCDEALVTASASVTCNLVTNPRIQVTQNCSEVSASPGELLTYSGTVRNAGDVTLTNIVVTNDRTGATPVFTALLLPPGAATNFTGSYTVSAGTDCSITSTLTATGTDKCSGAVVTNVASATCPVSGNPRVAVTLNCPPTQASAGKPITFSGTVSNAGDVALANITVVSDQTAPGMVLTVAILAPGASANFTATFTSPIDACAVTCTVTARGSNTCAGVAATATQSATCSLLTKPAIVVWQNCPPISPTAGGVLTYSGTVSNSGNSTLTNVVVTNDRTGTSPILTVPSLAPRATANFTGSYVTLSNCCVDSSTVRATGRDCNNLLASDTATRTCSLLTHPAIAVTVECASDFGLPLVPGSVLSYSGIVSNSGNIALTNVTVVNTTIAGSPVFGSVTLAVGESAHYTGSFVVPSDFCGTYTVTARGIDLCSQSPATSSATTTCPVITTPGITVTKHCPAQPPARGGTFVLTGTVSNPGDVTLTNVYVVNDQPAPNTPVIGPITLAPGASTNFSASYPVPDVCCELIDTLTASGQDTCSSALVVDTTTEVCPLLTTPRIFVELNCPRPVPAVGELYEFTGSITNIGDIVLTNVYVVSSLPEANTIVLGPIELAPGESEGFYGSFTVATGVGALVATASGRDSIMGRLATASADCAGVPPDPTNNYTPVAGTFNGLFYNTNDVQNANAGFFTLNVTASGDYTSTVRNGGKKFNVKGTFDSNGHAVNSIARTGTSPLVINWQAVLSDSNYLSGSVAVDETVAPLAGVRAVFSAQSPTEQAGKYTLLMPGVQDDTASPAGTGYGTIVVDPNGSIHLKSKLADNGAPAQNVAMGRNGEWPLYLPLYSGKGLVLGWLRFADDGANDISGVLYWFKPNMPGSKLYKQGFSISGPAIGSRFVAPTAPDSVLQITDGIVVLNGGNLPDSVNPVTFGPSSKLVNDGPNTLKLKFTPSTGVFSGTFKEAGTAKVYNIKGAVLQRQNFGSGFAPGSDQSGRVVFQSAPEESNGER